MNSDNNKYTSNNKQSIDFKYIQFLLKTIKITNTRIVNCKEDILYCLGNQKEYKTNIDDAREYCESKYTAIKLLEKHDEKTKKIVQKKITANIPLLIQAIKK